MNQQLTKLVLARFAIYYIESAYIYLHAHIFRRLFLTSSVFEAFQWKIENASQRNNTLTHYVHWRIFSFGWHFVWMCVCVMA